MAFDGTSAGPTAEPRRLGPARALIAVLLGSAIIVGAQVMQRPVPAMAGPGPIDTNTPTNTATDTATNTATSTATDTPTNTATNTPTGTPPTATATASATATVTAAVTSTATRTPSRSEAGQCDDGIDNDNNGFTDCHDI